MPSTENLKPIKVLITDDDKDIHTLTKLVLDDFEFEGRPIEFISAYSGAEALEMLALHPETAVVLLDVMMESDYAGLDIIEKIRGELANHNLRIVIRTGQAGKAPETSVIRKYDIHDYLLKTDIRAIRLETTMWSCLRAHRDLMAIEMSKRGLEKIIDASADLYKVRSTVGFATGALEQLSALLNTQGAVLLTNDCKSSPHAVAATGRAAEDLTVITGTGRYSASVGKSLFSTLPPDLVRMVHERIGDPKSEPSLNPYIGVYSSDVLTQVFIAEQAHVETSLDERLLSLFSRNIGIGFENITLRETIEETQREIAYRLGGAVEFRSKETGNHIRRVAEMSMLIARAYGLANREAEIIGFAAPLHDVGKIGIPDHILNKPGKHTPEEWEIMKTHAQLGYDLVFNDDLEILKVGGLIALEHHERWDGTGYPFAKKGDEISIYARVVGAIDVFDALGSKRCYKEAWGMDDILNVFKSERGKHFDPTVTDLVMSNVDGLNAIRAALPD